MLFDSGKTQQRNFDAVSAHVLWRETHARLQTLLGRAREGKEPLPASEFARWVRASGLVTIFSENSHAEPLEVSAEKIRALIDEILFVCAHAYNGRYQGHVEVSAVEQINRRLDQLVAHVEKLSPRSLKQRRQAITLPPPDLHVINGGTSS